VGSGKQSKPVPGGLPRAARGWKLQAVPLMAGLVVSFIGVQLGNWQLRRAEEKTEVGKHVTELASRPIVPLAGQAPAEWQRVSLAGEWLPHGAIFLDNRVHEGRSGYHVLAPLRLADGEVVLVNRGWIAAGTDRSRLPEVAGGEGAAMVEGVVRHPESRPFTLAREAGAGRLWQLLDLPAYRQAFGVPVAEFVVQQTSAEPDGLVRDWPRPDLGVDRHRGYAVQWYGLAATAAVMTGLYVLRTRGRKESPTS
jgi:surfeit locus 1 family protein